MIVTKIVEDIFNLPFDICNIIASYLTIQISYFPMNVKYLIMEYIPYHKKYILNKYFYNIYHRKVVFSPYDSYIRNIIRHDMMYIFHKLYFENKDKWRIKKKISYKSKKIMSYIELLNQYCIEYKSNKCRKLLKD